MNITVTIDRPKDRQSKETRGIVQIFEGNHLLIKEYFISGPWGKGHAPVGKYLVTRIQLKLDEAFKRCGFGWNTDMIPQFETDRTMLGLHPDGGNWVGTQGCIGLQFCTNEFNKKFYNLLKSGLDKGNIELEVVDVRN